MDIKKTKTVELAPVVLFVYNRPKHTRQTIEALLLNEYAPESDLIIYADGAKEDKTKPEVDEIRNYIKSITGFKSIRIIERAKNEGLANNIINGVSTVVNQYGKVIVLEDDLITSPYFLKFMNEALNLYENDEKVISIHGFSFLPPKDLPDTYFIRGADCWGWATWKRGWDLFESDGTKLLAGLQRTCQEKEFDFEDTYPYIRMLKQQIKGKVNSWAIRWYASAFLNNKLTLHPGRSLVYNTGRDGSGVHGGTSSDYETSLATLPLQVTPIEVKESTAVRKLFVDYYRTMQRKNRFQSFIKRIFYK